MKQFIISILACITVLAFIIMGTGNLETKVSDESAQVLEDAIRRATVQCYALEGAYPESVSYLEEHYSLRIDYERYNVFYEGFASNVMPDITVIPKETNDEK